MTQNINGTGRYKGRGKNWQEIKRGKINVTVIMQEDILLQ
jgi:hypothetical protein